MRRTGFVACCLAGAALLVMGCGAQSRDNKDRPPTVVELNAVVTGEQVTIAPAEVGAGPLVLIVSNQSQTVQNLKLVGDQVAQSFRRLEPGDTTEFQTSLVPGDYTLSAGALSSVREAELRVGPERPSGQNDLLLP